MKWLNLPPTPFQPRHYYPLPHFVIAESNEKMIGSLRPVDIKHQIYICSHVRYCWACQFPMFKMMLDKVFAATVLLSAQFMIPISQV